MLYLRARRLCSRAIRSKTTDDSRGFAFLFLAIVLFLATAVGVTVLADYAVETNQRLGDTTQLADVYRGIVGDASLSRFGYLGDVGDYPARLQDLITAPSGATGWNGPYVPDALLSGTSVYDAFGSPLEYFLNLSAGSVDQLAIVSKGRDHSSSNSASDPNSWSQFSGTLPSAGASYFSTGGNADNLGYPDFSAAASAVNFEHSGFLNYLLTNKDNNASVNAVVPACPLKYNVVMTSDPRGTSDTITIPYSPASSVSSDPAQIMQFLQGYYDVSITSATFARIQYSESIAMYPGRTTTRNARMVDINSNATPTFSVTVTNNTAGSITIKRFGNNLSGGANLTAGQTKTFTGVAVCGNMTATNSSNVVIDQWVMPWGTNSTRTVGGTYNTVTITNTGGGGAANRRQLVISKDGIPLGTVYRRKTVTFSYVPNGASIVVMDQAGTLVASFTMGSSAVSQTY